jgi:hypothetical protein
MADWRGINAANAFETVNSGTEAVRKKVKKIFLPMSLFVFPICL